MNTFVIGSRLEIHHYSDWTGSAFLCFDDEEFRLPGEAAKILVDFILGLQHERRKLEEQGVPCTICGQPAGKALLLPDSADSLRHAMCAACHDEMVKLRNLGVTQLTKAAAERSRRGPDDAHGE